MRRRPRVDTRDPSRRRPWPRRCSRSADLAASPTAAIKALKGVSLEVRRGRDRHADRRQRRGQDDDPASASSRPAARRRRARSRYDGQDIARPRRRTRSSTRGISQVPEGRAIFPNLTVRENLEMGAYLQTDKALIAKAETSTTSCSLFPRLGERMKQAAGTLSGGEQQMLAIGRALMARPAAAAARRALARHRAACWSAASSRPIARITASGHHHPARRAEHAPRAQDRSAPTCFARAMIAMSGPSNELAENEEVKAAYLASRSDPSPTGSGLAPPTKATWRSCANTGRAPLAVGHSRRIAGSSRLTECSPSPHDRCFQSLTLSAHATPQASRPSALSDPRPGTLRVQRGHDAR